VTLVSIVVPVHNGARFLGQALESILAQDYSPLEIVVVDDGSDDGSAVIARSLGVRCLSQPRGGAASALNAGIAASSGELIGFLDHDDLMAPGSVSARARPLLAQPDLGYVRGYVQVFLEPGAPPAERFSGNHWDEPGPIPGPTSMLVRRSVFDVVGGYDPSFAICHDADWLLRARRSLVRGDVLPELVAYYRQHETNLTRDFAATQAEMFRVLRSHSGARA
jgi:glycosyltransferase involved in cell wall biosynthesis